MLPDTNKMKWKWKFPQPEFRQFIYYTSLSWSCDDFVYVATNMGEYCCQGDA